MQKEDEYVKVSCRVRQVGAAGKSKNILKKVR